MGTKYTPVTCQNQSLGALRAPGLTRARGCPGRGAPLSLDLSTLNGNIAPARASFRFATVGGEEKQGWNVPVEGVQLGANQFEENFVLKIQNFEAGGFEMTCRSVDLEKVGRAMAGNRRRGKREAPQVQDPENAMKAAARAKKKVRHLVKNMGATHLVTFNLREGPNTQRWGAQDWESWADHGRAVYEGEYGAFCTPDGWAALWDRVRRILTKVKGEFPYVAVLEQHKKGNFHLHVAWAELPGKKVNLNLVRGVWNAVLGGKGRGNVDVQYIKVRDGLDRSARVARYISKYTSKHFDDAGRFNKKRYWSSRQSMAAPRRYVLNCASTADAFRMAAKHFGVDMSDYLRVKEGRLIAEDFFNFPNGAGFWLAFIPGVHSGAPPPF